jgi:FkbM family methyltransferase
MQMIASLLRYVRLVRNISNWWLHLAVKLGINSDDPLVFRLPKQVRIAVNRRLLHEFKEIVLDECYTKGLMHPVPAGATVIDVGANAGFFSLFAASQVAGVRIVAYEPVAANFHLLDANRRRNPHVRLECVRAAVCGHTGTVELGVESAEDVTTAASIIAHAESRPERVTVACVNLADVLAAHRIDRCNLLKMDCEGAEYEILMHCPEESLQRIEQAAIEVHAGDAPTHSMGALSDFLRSCGFQTAHRGDILYASRRARRFG